MAETVGLVLHMVQKGDSPQHICTGNLDHLYLLEQDAEFRHTYDTAALVLADGMPIVWLSRLQHLASREQLPHASSREDARREAGARISPR